jgi:hypothetical protein
MQLIFVRTAEEMQEAGQIMARSVMMGMDTEHKPNRSKKHNRTALLQVMYSTTVTAVHTWALLTHYTWLSATLCHANHCSADSYS